LGGSVMKIPRKGMGWILLVAQSPKGGLRQTPPNQG
jgi:hypothetical protein